LPRRARPARASPSVLVRASALGIVAPPNSRRDGWKLSIRLQGAQMRKLPPNATKPRHPQNRRTTGLRVGHKTPDRPARQSGPRGAPVPGRRADTKHRRLPRSVYFTARSLAGTSSGSGTVPPIARR
jgi:hypothetical protein